MKKIHLIIGGFLFFAFANDTHAQFLKGLGDKAKKAAERTVERRVERESSKKTDEAIDGVLEGKSKKKSKDSKNDKTEKDSGRKSGNKTNSDFEPGNNIIVQENFKLGNEGDFPPFWNTNASGKIVTLHNDRWLEMSSPGVFLMENVKQLPENFTLEFDVFVPDTFSYYDYPLWIVFANLKNKKDFNIWNKYKEKQGKDKRNGLLLMLHPQEEGGKKLGYSEYELWENSEKISSNKIKSLNSFNVNNNQVRVQIWRQNQRLRVYLDGDKIWDLPTIFNENQKFNTLLFSRYESKAENNFHIANIRLASSGEDIRSKLMNEGKFSTNAILFNTNSATILPESNATISEIATILKENNSLSLTIIGHTDADGNKQKNISLSLQRAQSVKNELVSKYKISERRLNVDGKGDSQPIADNQSSEGKAQNRRVEFIKN
ncbi:OmpA family protein [Flavobacterium sp. NST-5]|uniref:OmpA family protein n=1 Tax=Flavobacterium ichthyis TaxID=2698827 RepID=A0ABW9Z692_9FLAO|nr:OmpA family protein [Flavobacterium ichthyis]NBL64358.1 OmpA family protein [Flavobacterium ichthyis]